MECTIYSSIAELTQPENLSDLLKEPITTTCIESFETIVDENDYFIFYFSGHGSSNTSTPLSESTLIESAHPYSNDVDEWWYVEKPEALEIRVHFNKVDLGSGDRMYVGDGYDPMGYYDRLTGSSSGQWSSWVYSDYLYIQLLSDSETTDWGFSIDKIEWKIPAPPYSA